MCRYLLFVLSTLLTWPLGFKALADEQEPEEEGPRDEQVVVVTADRSEQLRFECLRSIGAFDRDAIYAQQAQSVPELVGELPGVQLQQTNRGAGSPFVRGLTGPQNLILIDGVRLNTAAHRTGPNQYLALVDPFAIERLDLLRGPSSVLFGNGAMGSVISIRTPLTEPRPGELELGARAQTRLASADWSQGASMELSASGHDLGLLLGLSGLGFGSLRSGGGFIHPLSSYRAGFVHARLAWDLVRSLRLEAGYAGAMLRDAGRVDAAGNGDVRLYDNDDHLAFLRLRWDGSIELDAKMSFQRLVESIDRYRCACDDSSVVRDLDACLELDPAQINRIRAYADRIDVLGLDATAALALWKERIVLRSGFDLYLDQIASRLDQADSPAGFDTLSPQLSAQPRGQLSDGSLYLSLGVFLHALADLVDLGRAGRLRLEGGMRYSHFQAEAEDVPEIGDMRYAYGDIVGSASAGWILPGRLCVYFAFAQGFRAPNLQETTVLGNTGDRFELPNPDLRPERSNTFELGLRLAALDWLDMEAAYHYALIDDVISQQASSWQGQTSVDGKPVTCLVNGLEGVFQGADFRLRSRLWWFVLDAKASWMQGDILTDQGSTPARRIPPIFGRAGIRYQHPIPRIYVECYTRWALRQDRLHPGDRSDERICGLSLHSGRLRDPCDGTAPWVTLNLCAGIELAGLRIDLRLANLTDARYHTHGSSIDEPGFDVRLSVSAEY